MSALRPIQVLAVAVFAMAAGYQPEPAEARRPCGPATYGTPGCPYPLFKKDRYKPLNTSCRQSCTRRATPAERARCLRSCP
jgi:hypothetical protein